MRTQALMRRLETLSKRAPLPPGYHYQFDRNGGGGGPFYYNLAVVRDDQKGGDWIDVPGIGGLEHATFIKFIDGMLEGLDLRERIGKLPKAEQEVHRV